MLTTYPLGMAATAVFVLSYLIASARGLTAPGEYRDAEVEFYRTGKPGGLLIMLFLLNELAFVIAVVHAVTEGVVLGFGLMYAMTAMQSLLLPFHFLPFFRSRMVTSLRLKTESEYRSAALKKLIIAGGMVLFPFVIM